MSFLKGLKDNAKDIQRDRDSVGGFSLLPSGVYEATVKLAFALEAKSGAKGVEIHFTINDQTHRETFWITNKEGQIFYVSPSDKTKHYLPGYTLVNDLCLIATGKEISDMELEEKKVKLYNYEEKAELPTDVEAFTELHGEKVLVGMILRKEFKQTKNDDGEYEDTDEVREINAINKFFDAATQQTVNEMASESEAEFIATWLKRWEGKEDDRTAKKKAETKSSKPKAKKGSFF